MTCVTRARVIPSRRAIAAWFGEFPTLEEGLPLDRLLEQLDHPGRPRFPQWLGLSVLPLHGSHDPLGRHPACDGADVAVLERPFSPQSDLDRLFAVGALGSAPGDPGCALYQAAGEGVGFSSGRRDGRAGAA